MKEKFKQKLSRPILWVITNVQFSRSGSANNFVTFFFKGKEQIHNLDDLDFCFCCCWDEVAV